MNLRNLDAFSNQNILNHFPWYLSVSNNEMPAKFLIAKRIQVDFSKSESQTSLWKKHELATKNFLELFNNIKEGTENLKDLEIPDNSLLDLNATIAYKMLENCDFCSWNCNVDRTGKSNKKLGTCQLDTNSRVGSFFHHKGEELIYRGTKGSGTIFFTSCNMRCGFCQNGDISRDKLNGIPVSPELISSMAYKLGVEGCHNINFVGGDPTIHLHTIIEAIRILGNKFKPSKSHMTQIMDVNPDFFMYSSLPSMTAYNGEFNIPLLWNSNFFITDKTMKILRTVIDVWLPDHKFSNNKCSIKLARTPNYIESVTKNLLLLKEWSEDYSIRHLIMPNHVECCTKEIFKWIQQNIPKSIVNVMDQYHPDCFANPNSTQFNAKYTEISRFPTQNEIKKAYTYAKMFGINFEEITFEKTVTGVRI